MDATSERVALAIPEQRRELGLSIRQLARLSGVSRDTIAKLERGDHVNPPLVIRVAMALLVLEFHAEPRSLGADLMSVPWMSSFPPLPGELEAVS